MNKAIETKIECSGRFFDIFVRRREQDAPWGRLTSCLSEAKANRICLEILYNRYSRKELKRVLRTASIQAEMPP